MTKQDFLNNFYILYDQMADLASPGFEPNELSIVVSKCQENLVIDTYNYSNNKSREGFEETEQRIEDLGELVKYSSFTVFTNGFFTNSIEVVLPNTQITNTSTDFSDVYWFTIYEECVSDVLDCTIAGNTTVYTEPYVDEVTHAALPIALQDPFRRPYIKGNIGRVLRLRSEGRKHTLITDGTFNITKYKIGYIKKPTPIDLTTLLTNQVSQLSDEKHRELLNLTVQECMKIVKDKEGLAIDIQTKKD